MPIPRLPRQAAAPALLACCAAPGLAQEDTSREVCHGDRDWNAGRLQVRPDAGMAVPDQPKAH